MRPTQWKEVWWAKWGFSGLWWSCSYNKARYQPPGSWEPSYRDNMCLVAQWYPTLYDHMDCSPPGSSVHGDSPGKNTGVGCHTLLQGIFPSQGSNPGLPHCRWIFYHLSHQGSPIKLEWVADPFSRGTSWPRNQTRVSCIAGGFCTSWAIWEALS